MKKGTSLLLWLLAFILTLLLAVYQRLSGPTYPLRGSLPAGKTRVHYTLPRSGTSNEPLRLGSFSRAAAREIRVHYRRFPFIAGEDWALAPVAAGDDGPVASIPGQPAAGKVAYRVELLDAGGSLWLNQGKFVVARFKNEVPPWLLIPHILFMFAGMLLAFRAGLGALFGDGRWQRLVPWTLGVTVAGGLVLGPVVQKIAFGAFWTGFPLGGDLTDSKTLLAALFWLAAFLLRKKSRWWTVLATVLMVGVYLIPHSVLGSELDYKTGQVITAKDIRN